MSPCTKTFRRLAVQFDNQVLLVVRPVSLYSAALGRYEINAAKATQHGMTSFSPAAQNLVAAEILQEDGAVVAQAMWNAAGRVCRTLLMDNQNPASGVSGGHFTPCLATHAGVRLRTEHLGTGQPATEKEEFGRRKFKDQQTDGEHGLGAATCYFGFSSARRRTWS